jgi:leucine-rich repeat transmembrane neuronal protein 1/2
MITRIEDDTFVELKSLEALDLSNNNLLEVPAHIFNLPLLRNLYMSDMNFGDRGFETLQKIDKPIKAPLNILNIANLRLDRMPEFGILPYLFRLNISHNNMNKLNPQQFSAFCHLKEIEMSETRMDRCRCEEVTRFLYKNRDAEFNTPIYCDETSTSKTYSGKIFI